MRVFIWIAISAIILTLTIIIINTHIVSPVNEMNTARSILTEAKKNNAQVYASRKYQMALSYYDSAMINWQEQNKKFYLFKNYDSVYYFINLSIRYAQESLSLSENNQNNIEYQVKMVLQRLTQMLSDYDSVFVSVPLSNSQRKELYQGKMLFDEGIYAYEKKDFKKALKKLDAAESNIYQILSHTSITLETYFKSIDQWKKWVETGIAKSKKLSTSLVIVDKYARKSYLYKNGKIVHTFEIELGPNWIGNKNFQGDKSTPEGIYKIVSKKSKSETSYYKALLLNYPNEEDKKRFNVNKNNGTIHPEAKIGNLIEIHGLGGKGADWTNGCVALRNQDMDILYKYCPTGTEVIIVGSLKTFDEIKS